MSADEELEHHLNSVVAELKWGGVIPFLGAGASLIGLPAREPGAGPCPTCGRAMPRMATPWPVDPPRLPNGQELAEFLVTEAGLKIEDRSDLIRVAEYVATLAPQGFLYKLLRSVFNNDYPPTDLHRLIAETPGLLRQKGWSAAPQVVVTTNYDDTLERAFREVGQEFDLFVYMAVGRDRGRFVHIPPTGEPEVVGRANEYTLELDADDNLVRPAILKIHGTIHRAGSAVAGLGDSFVITEDDYVDYLTRNIEELLPKILMHKLQESTILFLGYSLRDWNVRAILRRLWDEARIPGKGWAVLQSGELLERLAWEDRNVKILPMGLEEYVSALRQRLHALPDRARANAPA